MKRRKVRRRKRIPGFLIVLFVICILVGAAYFGFTFFVENYRVKNVSVVGNIHHTDEEIKQEVMSGRFGDNSLYLSHKYKNKEITDIPFVQTINVSVEDKESIRITVYEKAVAGYVEYLGRYVYFDKDGIVVEISDVKTQGIPQVVGLNLDYVVSQEKLPVEDADLFKRVLNITKVMTKYDVEAQKVFFGEFGEITLYIDDITIKLGKEENLDVKVMNLPAILSNLEGKKGTLRMENYDESTKRVSFENEE